jgi:DNA polymerase-3 subunit alpha
MIQERYREIADAGALPFLLEEESLRDSLPDGKDYYEYVLKNVQLDRSNSKNSYIMYLAGKVDHIDPTKPCKFTEASTALPDIDVDFPTDYREKAIDYVRTKYGADKVCQITTFGRLSGRSAIKAVMRAEGSYDFETMNLVTEEIPDEAAISDQLEETGEDSIISWMLHNDGDKIADYCRLEDGILVGDYAEVFRKAIALEGTFQNQGKHAAGVIISSEKISDVSPMCRAKDGSAIAALDMAWLEKIGLVKFDFLGVDILNKIQEAWGPDIVSVPLNDEDTWAVIGSGNTKGCFQIENHLGRDWSKEIQPQNIEELAAIISIIRPGTLCSKSEDGRSMTKVYADRKNGIELVADTPVNRVIDTYGVLIYQETLLKICKQLASFNSANSIMMMKCISGDSLIYTSSGPKRIDQASSKDDILNIIDGKLNYSKIKKVWSTGNREVHRISTINGFHIDLTANHQVMTNYGWLPVSEITDEHYVLLPKRYKHKFTPSPSKDKMIICGYFLSEGCYSEKAPNPKITNSDNKVIRLISESVEREFGPEQTAITYYDNGVMDIRLLDSARSFIKAIFEKNKSKDKSIPSVIMKSSMEHRRILVSCYFDGDGTVSSHNLSIASASKEILLQIQSILLGDGIHASISSKFNSDREQIYYVLSICSRTDVSTFEHLYTEYVSERKKQSIRLLIEKDIEADNCDKKSRIPNNIVKACFGSENLNKICGHRINVGQCYKNSLTIDKARFINSMIGSDLMNEIISSEYYYFQVRSVVPVGEVEVFDYETEDDTHCGFINGILVHNSVGKKDAKKLFSLEERFINGCNKIKVITEKESKDLFTTIKSSSRYLFNKSHAVSYSFPAYWSAYIKAHRPLKFYEVWLKYSSHKLDPHAEVRNLVMSARLDNIEILPPSCEYLTEGFFIKGEAVVFGLSHIKGVAIRELDKLFSLMRTHGVKASLVTYLTEILPHVNKRTCEALIGCGCFQYLGVSRAAMQHYYECFSDLTDKELAFFSDKQFETPTQALEAAAAIKKEGGACATKSRVEKVKQILERLNNPGRVLHDLPGKIAASEEAAIGIALSCSYLDACLAAGVSDTTCREILRGKPGKRTLVVRVKEVKEHIIKSSEKKMSFITAEDDSAELDNIVCFADQYEQFGRFLYPGAMVAIYGELGKKRSFAIERVVEL